MNSLRIGLMSAALVAGLATASAQTVAADSVMQHVNGKRLSVGGYGEVAMSRRHCHTPNARKQMKPPAVRSIGFALFTNCHHANAMFNITKLQKLLLPLLT